VKLKRKFNLTKNIKRMRTKLIKIIYHKFGLKDKIKNKLNFYKKAKKKKIMRTRLKNIIP
jgi:hypothetical protein